MQTLFVAVAGAAGAALRYRLGTVIGVKSFPLVTLAINITGSFVLALILAGPVSGRWSPETSTAVTVGFLGAYTTYSTFSYETVELFRTGRTAAAGVYLTASVVGGLFAAVAGYILGSRLV